MSIERQMKIIATEEPATTIEGPHITVAFASSDLKFVDEHFGSATRLAQYHVGADSSTFLGVVEFSETRQDGNENKLLEKFDSLKSCDAVFCLAVGASAVRQLMAQQIQPIKLGERSPINEVLEYLQQEIREAETPWIRKALSQSPQTSENRIADLLDEDWEE